MNVKPIHKAFTIIEVMVSVVIVSLVGWGLLQTQAQSTYNVKHSLQVWKTALLAGPLIVHANQNLHNKEKTLYAFLQPRYHFTYDPMINALKAKKLHYIQKEYTFISLSPDENQTDDQSGVAMQNQGLYIDKVYIKSDLGTASAFAFRLNP